jgi:TPR repeat protein
MRFIIMMMAGLSLLLSSSIVSAQDKTALSDFDKGIAAFKNGQFEEARVLFAKSCDGGYYEGCNILGLMHDKGQAALLTSHRPASF